MYPTRIVLRPAHPHRVAKAVPSGCRNLMSSPFFPAAAAPSFWGPSSSRAAALGPFSGAGVSGQSDIFRLLDESVRAFDSFPSFFNISEAQQQQQQQQREQQRIWQPRFDVQEHDSAYELRGELPGVDAQSLDVQFVDPTTLVVRGRTESHRTQGSQPEANPATANDDTDVSMSGALDGDAATKTTSNTDTAAAPAETAESDAASVHSDSSYVQPTVEDDAPETASTLTGGSNNAAATPSTSTAQEAAAAAAAPAEKAARQAAASSDSQQQQQPSSAHYWLSERRTGTFQRTFRFPSRVDQEGVTASLRNGVLNINVPKAAVPEVRRIVVQ